MEVAGRSRVVAIAGLVVGQSTQAILIGGLALFLPLVSADLGLSLSQVGTIAAVATMAYALAQVPAGYVTERIGARTAFAVGLLVTNLAVIGFAATDVVAVAVVAAVVSGLFRALMFTPGMVLITSLFDASRSATGAGLFVVGGVTSSLLLNLVGPVLVDHIDWRWVMAILAAPGVLLAAYIARLPVNPRPEAGPRTRRDLTALVRSRAIWAVWGIQFVRLFAFAGLMFWVPTLVLDRGHSLDVAGLVTAALALSTVPANVVGGYVSDRIGRPTLVIGACLTCTAAATLALTAVHSAIGMAVLAALIGLFVQAYFGPLFTLPRLLVPDVSMAWTTSTSNTLANLGGFVSVGALGLVRESTGSLVTGLYVVSGACLAAAALTAVLDRRVRDRTSAPESAESPVDGDVLRLDELE